MRYLLEESLSHPEHSGAMEFELLSLPDTEMWCSVFDTLQDQTAFSGIHIVRKYWFKPKPNLLRSDCYLKQKHTFFWGGGHEIISESRPF